MNHSEYWQKDYAFTKEGVLHGKTENGIRRFLGVPYAQPPINSLRFKKPQPMQPWDGVREAVAYSSAAIQRSAKTEDPFAPSIFSGEMHSEDCLYLNIFSPAKAPGEKLPVYIWVHGGGMMGGTAMDFFNDGDAFAKKGVVMVSINYRLGFFGFFCHPELLAESGDGSCGNYALYDIRAAALWVKENIEAFGGDPQNISIGGQSGGAVGTNCMFCSPLMEGVVERVVIESGTCMHGNMQPAKLEDMVREGAEFSKKIGLPTLDELRAADAISLFKLAAAENLYCNYCIDGVFLPKAPADILISGEMIHADVLVGATAQEFAAHLKEDSVTPQMFIDHVNRCYAENATEILALYPHETSAQAGKSYHTLLGESHLVGAIRTAEECYKHGRRAYVYYFSRATLGESGEYVGALHGGELPYVFGLENYGGKDLFVPEHWEAGDYAFSDCLTTLWTQFMRSGNPGGGWPQFTKRMELCELNDGVAPLNADAAKRLEAVYKVVSKNIYGSCREYFMPGAPLF